MASAKAKASGFDARLSLVQGRGALRSTRPMARLCIIGQMSQGPKRIEISEPEARRLTLAQAVESSDADGKLLSQVERAAIDSQAMQSARPGPDANPERVAAFLGARAEQVLRVVGNRSPALAALAMGRTGTQWLAVAAPLAAVLIGALTDRIANPHRVDLLSLPLLTILGWNLVVYALLLVGVFARPTGPTDGRMSPLADLTRRFAAWHPRLDALQGSVVARFSGTWHDATSKLQAQRISRVLHLAAAGWALGVVLSLFTRGLVVEYRVGWESTFLNAEQVQAILRVLLLPALALLPFEPFSVQDIAALRFTDSGQSASPNTGSGFSGARWVYLYASLLALVVIAPRLLLALVARWREARLARRIVLSLDTPYYRRLLALANPTHIQLGVMAQSDEDHLALLRVLLPRASERDIGPELLPGPAPTLLRASTGESLTALRITQPSGSVAPNSSGSAPSPAFALPSSISSSSASQSALTAPARPNWAAQALARLGVGPLAASARPVPGALRTPADDADAVVQLVRSADALQAAAPLLHQLARPVLLLLGADRGATGDAAAHAAQLARCRSTAAASGLDAEILDLGSVARCWVQQPVLFEAIGRCLPAPKRDGFARLVEARRLRNRERLARSVEAIANQLLEGAREVEAVRAAPPSVTRLIKSADREADALARRQASAALVERLQAAAMHTQATLLQLHALDDAAATPLENTFTGNFEHSAPVSAREAGMAGAATGAATGASVDLVTGGLTLGAAAALGALVGGGAALAGAAWKNRSSPSGAATVQLSDDMLHALVQVALLRYLAVVHAECRALFPELVDQADAWPIHTAAIVAPRTGKLAAFWAGARNPAMPHAGEALAAELGSMVRELFRALYPAAPPV